MVPPYQCILVVMGVISWSTCTELAGTRSSHRWLSHPKNDHQLYTVFLTLGCVAMMMPYSRRLPEFSVFWHPKLDGIS